MEQQELKQTQETQSQETTDTAAQEAVDTTTAQTQEAQAADNNNQNDKSDTKPDISLQKDSESDDEYLERITKEVNEKADKQETKETKKTKQTKGNSKTADEPAIVKDLNKPIEIPTDIKEKMKAKGYDIDKFKYLDDVVRWGSEAEKGFGKVNSDNIILKNRLALYENELKKTQEQLSIYSNNSEGENEEAIEQFRTDFELNPMKAIQDLISKNIKAPQENGQQYGGEQLPPEIVAMRNEAITTAQNDFSELAKGMNEKEVLELNQQLLELSREHPNITSIKTLKAILDSRDILRQQKIAAEREEKERQKEAATFIPNRTSAKQEGASGLLDKIHNVSTMEELDKYEQALA